MALSRRRVQAFVKGANCDWCDEPVAVAFFHQRGGWWKRLLRLAHVHVIYSCAAHVDRAQDAQRDGIGDVAMDGGS